jgi:chromosome segregation and condensation protein ScpB
MILRSLAIRGLVERLPDPEHSSGFLYQPTFDVMKHLGMQKQEDLPEFEKFRELLKVFDAEQKPAEEKPLTP